MSVFVKLYNEKPYGKTDSENGGTFLQILNYLLWAVVFRIHFVFRIYL